MTPPVAARIDRIPVTLLTGFLGSGKTTLLQRLLHEAAFARTAVIINELGTVGLDHHLVRGASGTTRVLENGCVCCSVRDDLEAALADLYWDRLHQRIPRFAQVVIETTGLADPGPLLRLLQGSGIVAERYGWARVVCTIDACIGAQQLATRTEPARQAALADVILITKTDLAEAQSVTLLEARVQALNDIAPRYHVTHGAASSEAVAALSGTRGTLPPSPAAGLRSTRPAWSPSPAVGKHPHGEDVMTFAIAIGVLTRAQLERVLVEVASRHAPALLRIKGAVRVVDATQPLVVQAVHDHVYPLVALDAAEIDCAAGTLVFIATVHGAGAGDALEADIRAAFAAADARARQTGLDRARG